VDESRTIHVWDLQPKELATSFDAGATMKAPTQVAFDKAGQRIALVGESGFVEVWDLQTTKKVVDVKEPGPVNCVAFSANGRYLAYGGENGLLKICDSSTGAHIVQLTGHQNSVLSLAFSPDPDVNYLVSGSWDGTVKLWDVRARTLLQTFEGHGGMITSVCFSANGRRIACAAGPVVRLFDTMHKHQEIKLQDQKAKVTGICFCNHDGGILASITEHGIIKTWNGTPIDTPSR
jgi:WD40 repeat protein